MTARQLAVQLLFSVEENRLPPEEAADLFFSEEHYDTLTGEDVIFDERPDEEQMAYIMRIAGMTYAHLDEIDAIIEKYARGWKKSRLPKTTLAVLRCAICEILFCEDIPNSAAVDEAVEQGKRYGSPDDGRFINGLLGSFLREMKEQ